MMPYLSPGNTVLVLRRYPIQWLKKNDVVVFDVTDVPKSQRRKFPSKLYIKRVTALPGEQIITQLSWLSGSFSLPHTILETTENCRKWYVPENHVFLEGDNSSESHDSKSLGPIHKRFIRGKLIRKLG